MSPLSMAPNSTVPHFPGHSTSFTTKASEKAIRKI